MSEVVVDPSEEFGRTKGLFVYNLARSMDYDSERPDNSLLVLAEDAVRTAIRFESEDQPVIDIELATRGLIAELTKDLPTES
jgi:hypothetical protein